MEERRLLEYRYGLTAAVHRPTRRAIDVPLDEFQNARPGFEAKMRRYAPRSVAFLGERAFSAMMDQAWGRYPAELPAPRPGSCPTPAASTKPSPSSCGRPSAPGRQRETFGHGGATKTD